MRGDWLRALLLWSDIHLGGRLRMHIRTQSTQGPILEKYVATTIARCLTWRISLYHSGIWPWKYWTNKRKKSEGSRRVLSALKGTYAANPASFEKLCLAENAKLHGFVYCLEGKVGLPPCRFAMAFGYRYFCQCPLRVYAVVNLK